MRRLKQTLAAAGVTVLVGCSDNAPTKPLLTADAASPTLDTQSVRMSRAAQDYMQQLRAGVAGRTLNDAQRLERMDNVEHFIRVTTSSINSSGASPEPTSSALSEPEIPTLPPWGVFVESGTFTDLCLPCQTATSFAQAYIIGILQSTTTALITTGGKTYYPSSGTVTCPSGYCLSQIDLHPIVDCRVNAASGTATGSAAWMYRAFFANMTGATHTSYDSGECFPVGPIPVTLGSSDISVGTTTQALSPCLYSQWSSNAPWIASVSSLGVITGVASGSAEISVTCNANRGSAMIKVHLAEEVQNQNGDSCDDPMTPAVESCDDTTSQNNDSYSVTYTRPGYYGEADDSWFTSPDYYESYKIICDVTDWYEWNSDHTVAHYVGTDVNSCWLEPYNGGHH